MIELRVVPGWRACAPSCRAAVPGPVGSRARERLRRCDLTPGCLPLLRAVPVARLAAHLAASGGRRRPGRLGRARLSLPRPGARSPVTWARRPARVAGRFAGRGLAAGCLPRPGRGGRGCPAAVVALACQLPAATGVPLSRWTGPELLAEITKAGLGRQLSVSSVLRILAEHPVKPWQYQSWISPRDPDFAARASVILDLYQGFHQGKRLRPATASCPWTPSRPSRPAAAAAPPPQPGPASPCGSSTNTSATVPSPCWPRSTFTPKRRNAFQKRASEDQSRQQVALPHGLTDAEDKGACPRCQFSRGQL